VVLWRRFAPSLFSKVSFPLHLNAHSLTTPAVRDYHGTYYVPHNLTLIVAGKLSDGSNSLLSVVQEKVEPSIIAHGQDKGPRPPGWRRPFVETESANRVSIRETVKEVVEFPEKDESSGEIMIGFMGTSPDDLLESQVRLLSLRISRRLPYALFLGA
jgi:Zn-dependent M16 (insulinase) family peptidase